MEWLSFLPRLGRAPLAPRTLLVGTERVPLQLVRHGRARRYVLRLGADGTARVTIPRGGSAAAAVEFAGRNIGWLEQQLRKRAAQPRPDRTWRLGTEILLRGESVRLEAAGPLLPNVVRAGQLLVRVADCQGDLRRFVEARLWEVAAVELPPRVRELAAQHGLTVRRVSIRNQRTRWGSCSVRGVVSLNWRLLQAPAAVRDYLILHELMHVREMNHSARFWRAVAEVCPGYAECERWLKAHDRLLK